VYGIAFGFGVHHLLEQQVDLSADIEVNGVRYGDAVVEVFQGILVGCSLRAVVFSHDFPAAGAGLFLGLGSNDLEDVVGVFDPIHDQCQTAEVTAVVGVKSLYKRLWREVADGIVALEVPGCDALRGDHGWRGSGLCSGLLAEDVIDD